MASPETFLSRKSNYFVDVFMSPKFRNSSISLREVIITSILQRFEQKNYFSEECSWYKLNNLELPQRMASKFYMSGAKGLKLKVRKSWVLTLTFVEVTGEKVERCSGGRDGHFWSPILNRVK